MPYPVDPAVAQAIRQADAAWAAVREAHTAIYWSAAGVIVNFLLALVAITIPAWQRRMRKRDDAQVASRSKQRFIDAFKILADAQDAVVAATALENPEAVQAFARAELVLRAASEALTQSSAAAIPVDAIMCASTAQHNAAMMLSHYPDLTNYGSNLLFYNGLGDDLRGYAIQTRSLFERIETASAWDGW